MKVRSARVSLGSHDQYRPHDVLAHTAPVIMPSPSSHSAGYSAASDMTFITRETCIDSHGELSTGANGASNGLSSIRCATKTNAPANVIAIPLRIISFLQARRISSSSAKTANRSVS